MRYATLLIDFDGTLFDTHNAIRRTLSQLAAQRGIAPFDPAAIDAAINSGLTLADMLRPLVSWTDPASLDIWIEDYRQIYNSGIGIVESAPYPGIEEAMRTLHHHGAELFVVSNKGEASVSASLEHHRLRQYFREVIAATGARPTKPDPMSFVERVLPLIHAKDAQRVLMVGDTEVDITYARNIGATSCWATYGYGHRGRCKALAPRYAIPNPGALLQYMFD
jgi:phosphoglycolate phosphatase